MVLVSFCIFTACDEQNFDLDEVALTDDLVSELQQAYPMEDPNTNISALTIRFCLGSVNGKIVVSFDADTPDFGVIELAGR